MNLFADLECVLHQASGGGRLPYTSIPTHEEYSGRLDCNFQVTKGGYFRTE